MPTAKKTTNSRNKTNKKPTVTKQEESKDRFLTMEEMLNISSFQDEIKLGNKDREIVLLKISNKTLEKTIKELELSLLGNTLADKDREIQSVKELYSKSMTNIKSKYNIKSNFGFNTDTGLIIEE